MISRKIFKVNDPDCELTYTNALGLFITYKKGNIFSSANCREVFAYELSQKRFQDNFYGFSLKNINITRLNKFFKFFESKLNLVQSTIFYKTDDIRVVLIKPSPFWLENRTNQEIFSLLLRCGAIYYSKGKSIEDALEDYPLTYRIFPVIDWFFQGNTKPTYSKMSGGNGIVDFYYRYYKGVRRVLPQDQIEQLLVKP